MRLRLVRHGQTPNNVTGALDTAFPGAGLTELGSAQARTLPAALRDEEIGALHASPLVRTQLTAAPLAAARGLPVDVVPGFQEVSAGALELRSDPEAVQAYAACLHAWMAGDVTRAMPGGSDGQAFLTRYDRAVRSVSGGGGTVVVVSHGAAIRVWTAVRTGMPVEKATALTIANTGSALLDGCPDEGWRLLEWHAEPLGGAALLDTAAHDVTGESAAAVEGA